MTPPNGARTSAATSVTAVFSEAIDPATRKMTLIPAQKLLSGATYTVTVTGGAKGVKDLAGNALAASKIWRFSVR